MSTPTTLETARAEALQRMSGCRDAECHACRANQAALDNLIREAENVGRRQVDEGTGHIHDAMYEFRIDRIEIDRDAGTGNMTVRAWRGRDRALVVVPEGQLRDARFDIVREVMQQAVQQF